MASWPHAPMPPAIYSISIAAALTCGCRRLVGQHRHWRALCDLGMAILIAGAARSVVCLHCTVKIQYCVNYTALYGVELRRLDTWTSVLLCDMIYATVYCRRMPLAKPALGMLDNGSAELRPWVPISCWRMASRVEIQYHGFRARPSKSTLLALTHPRLSPSSPSPPIFAAPITASEPPTHQQPLTRTPHHPHHPHHPFTDLPHWCLLLPKAHRLPARVPPAPAASA
jgi:hypothetical protein